MPAQDPFHRPPAITWPRRATARGHIVAAGMALALVLAACSGPSTEQRLASARQYLERDEPAAAAIEAKNFLADI